MQLEFNDIPSHIISSLSEAHSQHFLPSHYHRMTNTVCKCSRKCPRMCSSTAGRCTCGPVKRSSARCSPRWLCRCSTAVSATSPAACWRSFKRSRTCALTRSCRRWPACFRSAFSQYTRCSKFINCACRIKTASDACQRAPDQHLYHTRPCNDANE